MSGDLDFLRQIDGVARIRKPTILARVKERLLRSKRNAMCAQAPRSALKRMLQLQGLPRARWYETNAHIRKRLSARINSFSERG